MIEAYMDESGIHDGSAVCVIAGYFGDRREWRKFEADWKKLLHDHLVPMNRFHAAEFVMRRGFFKKWTDITYSALINGVLNTIVRHKIYPVSFGIVVDDFNSFSEDERKFFTGAKLLPGLRLVGGCPSKPYFVPFHVCLRTITGYVPKGGRAHFFFGLDRTFYGYAMELYHKIKTDEYVPYRDKLGDVSFPLAKKTAPLQCADLLAYLTHVHMKENLKDGNWNTRPPDILRAALQRSKSLEDFRYFDKKALQDGLNPQTYNRPGEA